MRTPGGIRARPRSMVLRGLLLLGFLFGLLAVHPCPRDSAEHTHVHQLVAVAASEAHHLNAHHAGAGTVAPAGTATHVSPSMASCMGGACAVGTREYADEAVLAPVPDTGAQVQLNPVPLGSAAPGAVAGWLHSGRSPGAVPERGPEAARLSVLRT